MPAKAAKAAKPPTPLSLSLSVFSPGKTLKMYVPKLKTKMFQPLSVASVARDPISHLLVLDSRF